MSSLEVFARALLPIAGRTGLSFLEEASRSLAGMVGAPLCLIAERARDGLFRPVVVFEEGRFRHDLASGADVSALEVACRLSLGSGAEGLEWHATVAAGAAVCILSRGALDETARMVLAFLAARAPSEIVHMKSERRALLESRLGLMRDASGELLWHWHLGAGHIEWSDASLAEGTSTYEAWCERIHLGDRERVCGALEQLRSGALDAWEDVYRYLHADGTTRIEHARAALERRQDGTPFRVIGSLDDVTEAKRHEQRLILAERMAAMGTLAAGVAHEINNPLAYAKGNVEYVLERLRDAKGIDPDIVSALEEAREGAERVRRIVQDIRLFARPEGESIAPIDVDRVVEAALTFVADDLSRRGRLEKELRSPPPVSGNETRLGHVVLTLLMNAIQALPEGSPDTNVVRVETGVDDRGRVLVSVRDTGPGMPSEVIGRIFDPFFTTKVVGSGTGLGLAIAHSIVSSLGGEIAVDSAPGAGSTFRVTLPLSNVLASSARSE